MSKIVAVVVEPEGIPKTEEVFNCMEDFEGIVGGEISIVFLSDDYVIICKQKKRDEAENRVVMNSILHGNLIIAKRCIQSKEIIGLSEEEADTISGIFSHKIITEESLGDIFFIA